MKRFVPYTMDTERDVRPMGLSGAALESSVTVACRPSERKGFADFSDVKHDIKQVVKAEVEKLYGLGFRGADLLTACFGQAVTSLMGAQWDSVMHADVIGTISNAYKLDEQNAGNNIGKYHLATAVTTTVLMASVGSSSQKGLSLKQLKLCFLKPDAFQHIDIDSTLNQLENIVHYMYRSSIGGEQSYWFQSKPNINILINQAKGDVKEDEVNAEILRMVKHGVQNVAQVKVLVDPIGDVPEQKQLTFVVMHPKYAAAAGGNISNSAKNAIRQIAQMRGSAQRVYRNTLLFLLCSEAGRAALSMKLREFLACDKIITEYGSQLDADQKKDVLERKRQSGQSANEQLIHAYNTVVKCVRDDLQIQEIITSASEFAPQLTVNVLNCARMVWCFDVSD